MLDEDVETGEPENYLIVGVDNAAGLPGSDPVHIGRDPTLHSDTIMILRTDPASAGPLLSLPRDLFVPIPGTGTAHQHRHRAGRRPLLIRTIGENFGIPIHHYVQVNFAAFRGLVDAIDGVPIYVPRPAQGRGDRPRPPRRGLPDARPHRGAVVRALPPLRGAHRLPLGRGPRSDIGRIARQQDFIRRALTRAIDRGARNPGRSTSSSTSGWTASPSTVSSRPATSSTWAPGSGPSTPTACRPTPWPARRTR